jgi:hypothetical protein
VRIISDGRDYYDCIQAAGQDQTLIYHRQTDRVSGDWSLPQILRPWWNRWQSLLLRSHTIGFCGKIYGAVQAGFEPLDRDSAPEAWCYSAEEVDHFIAAHMREKFVNEYRAAVTKRRPWRNRGSTWRTQVEKFFADVEENKTKYVGLFTELDAPIFLWEYQNPRRMHKAAITKNPCLAQYEFYRVFDAYTAYQELAMYLGAQARPEKPIPAVPDKVMVGAKGFDKHSFRREPGSKKRRRKK